MWLHNSQHPLPTQLLHVYCTKQNHNNTNFSEDYFNIKHIAWETTDLKNPNTPIHLRPTISVGSKRRNLTTTFPSVILVHHVLVLKQHVLLFCVAKCQAALGHI